MTLVGLTNVLRLQGERYSIKVNTVVANAVTRMSDRCGHRISSRKGGERLKEMGNLGGLV